jgi:hypothetical protein
MASIKKEEVDVSRINGVIIANPVRHDFQTIIIKTS